MVARKMRNAPKNNSYLQGPITCNLLYFVEQGDVDIPNTISGPEECKTSRNTSQRLCLNDKKTDIRRRNNAQHINNIETATDIKLGPCSNKKHQNVIRKQSRNLGWIMEKRKQCRHSKRIASDARTREVIDGSPERS